MFEKIDKRFETIIEIANSNGTPTDIIKKAYNVAKELHKEQKRKDGTPYISHPVEVALILAKLNFDENVISAGLLHDTIEDCSYTEEMLKQDFNEIIFQLVDCVSAIDKTKYVFDEENIFEDPEFVKSSAEEQTFKKLIKLGKNNPCGFAIKFADRLHNLRTIEAFSYAKQLEKVRETEKWVLPIAKALESLYFYTSLKNECFKIVYRHNAELFLKDYEFYHKTNRKNVEELICALNGTMSNYSVKTIKLHDIKESDVYENLLAVYKNMNIQKASQCKIIKVANYNVFIIYKNISYKEASDELISVLHHKLNLKIIDANINNLIQKPFYLVQDKYKNKYRFYLLTESEYSLIKVGTLNGQNLDRIDEDNINELDHDIIHVKTRSGEIKYMPKNSTVLDFAFKIHRDIGFSFKYAIVNDGKTQAPPYTKLNDGDKVEIITEKYENDKLKNNAKLRWLAYVNTEFAKKVLVKWFEAKLANS